MSVWTKYVCGNQHAVVYRARRPLSLSLSLSLSLPPSPSLFLSLSILPSPSHHRSLSLALALSLARSVARALSADRGGNTSNGLKDLCAEQGSSQGQNPALTVLLVPNSLHSGLQLCPGPLWTLWTCNTFTDSPTSGHPRTWHTLGLGIGAIGLVDQSTRGKSPQRHEDPFRGNHMVPCPRGVLGVFS